MSYPSTRNVDPTAGVPLMPRRIRCPRCGFDKGVAGHARPGLCSSCSSSLAPADRLEWAVSTLRRLHMQEPPTSR